MQIEYCHANKHHACCRQDSECFSINIARVLITFRLGAMKVGDPLRSFSLSLCDCEEESSEHEPKEKDAYMGGPFCMAWLHRDCIT